MSEKEDKLKVEIEKQQEIERQIDESISQENYRDITKMQAPDQWPDPPEKNEESSGDE